tara:strand:+ start:812 stop:3319 length:2508 start_codon:yes stop_codon:yes gene_type:complete
MFKVYKRDESIEDMDEQKIMNRIKTISVVHNISVPLAPVCLKVMEQLSDNISSERIDELLAEQLVSVSSNDPDYGRLAAIIAISNLHKKTDTSFKTVISKLYHYKNNGKHNPLVSKKVWNIVSDSWERLESEINYENDFLLDYFGLKTLERAYLLRMDDIIMERPQHMWMRVALGIHGSDLDKVFETYHCMSRLEFTHATPTLFNAGTPRPQLSSCFLIAMEDDSIAGIYNTLSKCAAISKWAGGLGLHCSNIRAKKTRIGGTNGTSNGLVPMLKVYNETMRYVDQGGGKRNGSCGVYLELWHLDVFDFLDLKKNHGDENARARDLFYAVWVDDEFMRRVKANDVWYLCCPKLCPGLNDVYGNAFVELYNQYIKEQRYSKKIQARELWLAILDAQMETGTPYILYKDAANRKSNQQNLGTIKSSNLCTEIIEYSSPDETAVCNLASIALSKCVRVGHSTNSSISEFDFNHLIRLTKIVTRNLNKIIDVNYYPTEETRRSNLLHRPLGIGVQGLADVFALMDIAFDSEEAIQLNKDIFETMYYATLSTSMEISRERKEAMCRLREALDNDYLAVDNLDERTSSFTLSETCRDEKYREELDRLLNKHHPILAEMNNLSSELLGSYSSFVGSPLYKGKLQFDLWDIVPSTRYDWTSLRSDIRKHGIRNSLLLAPMPTASTSQILGNNECFEPFTNNIYSRRTLAGEFTVVNKYLIQELKTLGLWNRELKDNIIQNRGSIQHITNISQHIKAKYKTSWEMSMKTLINMAADRGAYICQSQSMNLWIEDPTYAKLTAMHFYSWEKGLKTGIYYLRRKPKHNAQQFTIVPKGEDECEMCGS